MKQQRRYKEPQDTLWGKFLSGFMAVVFAMSTLTLIPIASAINGEPNEAQIQQQEELADQTSGKDEKAAEPAADEQKLEPVELLSIASVEDEDDADDAAPADATLKVKAQNATVTYNGNDVATELVVPAGKDVKFTVKAANGFTLDAAAVKLTDAKGETTLTPNAGEYTVAADRVADGATVVVTAEAAAGEPATSEKADSSIDAATSTEQIVEPGEVKTVVTNIAAKAFGITVLAADTGISSQSINNGEDLEIYVGSSTEIKSNNGNHWSVQNRNWSSGNESIATVSGNGSSATVTGNATGTTTITYSYQYWSGNLIYGSWVDQTETIKVTVAEVPQETLNTTVYVYANLMYSDGVTEDLKTQANSTLLNGLKLNGKGWYTLGYIQNAMAKAPTKTGTSDDAVYQTASEADTNRVIGMIGSMTRDNDTSDKNLDFPISAIDIGGWSLHGANGANDFNGAPDPAWHLDGTATIVTYTWKDGVTNETLGGPIAGWANSAPNNEVEVPKHDGYVFKEWVATTDADGDVTYTATYVKDSYGYTVKYFIDEDEIDAATVAANGWTTGGTAEYGTTASVTPSPTATIAETNYMLESTNHSVTIDADATKNVINVVYTKDSIGTNPDPNTPDGVADKYQATIKYAAGANGTVAGTTTRVVTLVDAQGNPAASQSVTPGTQGVTVSPATGYEFDKWTGDPAVAVTLNGGDEVTYTASFKPASFGYTVKYFIDEDEIDAATVAANGWTTGGTAEYQSEVTISPEQRVTIEGKNYILDSADHKIASISATESDNVISVVYAVDEVVDPAVDPNPNEPGDGVPDYRQAVINYVSADDAQGRVAPDQKVVTLEADEMPSVQMIVLDGVTATPETGYVLAGWTAEDGTTVAPREMRDIAGGQTYTYTASFKGDFSAISATPYEGVFDGAYHTPTVNGTIEGDMVSFSADHRNVTNGPATVTITVTRGAETYTIDSTVTITPRPVVVTANDASKIYGEADPTLTAAVRSIEGNTASGLVGNDTVAYTVSRATGEDAGEYDITATGNAVQGNYAVTYMPATFTITAAGGNVVTADNIAGADGLTKMYDGQAASVEAEAARSGSTLLYSTDGVNFTTQNPVFTNAGSYDVYVMATNPNYEDTPVVRTTVTITPAPVTVTVGNAAKTAGAVDPTFAATVTGLVNGESAGLISYALTRTAGEDAGSYVITAAGDRVQGNYIVTYVPGALVITAALVPPAALPAGPAAPAAVAALDTILDDGVPLATIDDDENALAAFEEIHCWTHWLMIFGALVTIVYGLAVLYRRRHGIRDMDDFEGDITGGRKYDAAAERNPAAGNAFQAM